MMNPSLNNAAAAQESQGRMKRTREERHRRKKKPYGAIFVICLSSANLKGACASVMPVTRRTVLLGRNFRRLEAPQAAVLLGPTVEYEPWVVSTQEGCYALPLDTLNMVVML